MDKLFAPLVFRCPFCQRALPLDEARVVQLLADVEATPIQFSPFAPPPKQYQSGQFYLRAAVVALCSGCLPAGVEAALLDGELSEPASATPQSPQLSWSSFSYAEAVIRVVEKSGPKPKTRPWLVRWLDGRRGKAAVS